jgi:single-strand selective monofunctional uracil DNA glycosylase
MDLLQIKQNLIAELNELQFSLPVAYVYNPLVYAREPHDLYLSRYGGGVKEVVFVGMNPGPWGMTQTGVPFGEIDLVRNWLCIEGLVEKPPREHPKKQVDGFFCRRSEVSGRRLWGLFRERFETAERFFARFFVVNYCPLLFLDVDGRNITPDKLRTADQKPLLTACDKALRLTIEQLAPKQVIGVGNFAQVQLQNALRGMNVSIGKILHPSPASPAANNGWRETVLTQLQAQGIDF